MLRPRPSRKLISRLRIQRSYFFGTRKFGVPLYSLNATQMVQATVDPEDESSFRLGTGDPGS